MPARLSRKRYTEITRYLKAVIDDESKADRLRMAAVESLLEVYARHDRSELQREYRRRAAEGAQDASQPEEAPEAPESAEEAAERIIASVRQRGRTQPSEQ
jgi:hypothetical protein